MPIATARMARHRTAERLRAFGHQSTISFRSRGVAQRLMREVTTIADQVPEQRDLSIRPRRRNADGRKPPCHGDSRTYAELSHDLPAVPREHPMIRRRTQHSTTGQSHAKYLSDSLGPNQIALRLDDLLVRAHGPDFRGLTHELAN